MSETPKTTRIHDVCPNCGAHKQPDDTQCANCGFALDPACGLTPTGISPRSLAMMTTPSPSAYMLRDDMFVVFQFLPSASCVSLLLDRPLVMGRQAAASTDDFFSLDDLQANHHGVSRQHCRFWRMFGHLLVMDLGSTNGTFLSGRRLTPEFAYVVRPHSRLILGSLHLVVTFA